MAIKYKVGDLFASLPSDRKVVIPHVCNDEYVMGSGFVVPLIRKWPQVYEQYRNNRPPIGESQFVVVEDNIVVANMVAQHLTVRSHAKPIRYLHLANCMEQVRQFAQGDYEIICPLFGAKLAGGNWDFIEELIDEIWKELTVTVYQLPGEELREPNE